MPMKAGIMRLGYKSLCASKGIVLWHQGHKGFGNNCEAWFIFRIVIAGDWVGSTRRPAESRSGVWTLKVESISQIEIQPGELA
ncbi:hypothetical protein AMTR_s00099p00150650 [Amborella trichopoda]|uniref:Uncharacterized protein n=1 Tax=Amborella trichopoda TaxID=13333 RepID=W1NWT3_AMBTC|nr:hypothetical protein AMTR_s00099p00150650 [Amborella trichopoda]